MRDLRQKIQDLSKEVEESNSKIDANLTANDEDLQRIISGATFSAHRAYRVVCCLLFRCIL